MRRQRLLKLGLSLAMSLGVFWALAGSSVRADDPPKDTPKEAAAPAAPAAAPAPSIDPAASPGGADLSGAGYVGASTTAALTKDGDKVTTETLAKDVKHLKLAINLVWTLIC